MNDRKRDGWVAGHALRSLAVRFRDEARRLPRTAWRRWTTTTAAGFAAVLALNIALVRSTEALESNGVLEWEAEFLREFEETSRLSYSIAIWIQTLGTDITLAIIVIFATIAMVRAGQPIRATSILAAFALTDLAVRFAWLIWNRSRPTLIMEGAAAPGFASFPSGHTSKSLAVYGLLCFLWIRRSPSTSERAFATLVAATIILIIMAGRLRMGVHWPSDLAGGVIVGGAMLAVLATALTRAERSA